jgi:hypothetical protein
MQSIAHTSPSAPELGAFVRGHINSRKEAEGTLTCKIIELWQSVQNDANQRQVKGGNFDLHLRFHTPRVQVMRAQQAVDGTDSFPLHFADSVGVAEGIRL